MKYILILIAAIFIVMQVEILFLAYTNNELHKKNLDLWDAHLSPLLND